VGATAVDTKVAVDEVAAKSVGAISASSAGAEVAAFPNPLDSSNKSSSNYGCTSYSPIVSPTLAAPVAGVGSAAALVATEIAHSSSSSESSSNSSSDSENMDRLQENVKNVATSSLPSANKKKPSSRSDICEKHHKKRAESLDKTAKKLGKRIKNICQHRAPSAEVSELLMTSALENTGEDCMDLSEIEVQRLLLRLCADEKQRASGDYCSLDGTPSDVLEVGPPIGTSVAASRNQRFSVEKAVLNAAEYYESLEDPASHRFEEREEARRRDKGQEAVDSRRPAPTLDLARQLFTDVDPTNPTDPTGADSVEAVLGTGRSRSNHSLRKN
jgi:hypothetical protein